VRTPGLAGLVVVAVTAALPDTPLAAPIPGTALSQSLQMPTELVPSDEANQYLFPQHAAAADQALLGFGAAGAQSVAGSGVRGRLGESSVSFLYLRAYRFATALDVETPPVYLLGWGHELGGLRFGAAYSWSVRGDRRRLSATRTTSVFDRTEDTQSEFQTVGHHQASIGLGWGGNHGWSLDVVGELAWERLDYRFRDTEESLSGAYFRKLDENFTTLSGDLLPGGALRARVPFGSRVHLLGFGSYREISFDAVHTIRSEFHDSNGSRVDERTEMDHHHGQEWYAGAAFELGKDWRWIASAFWESRREAWRYRLRRQTATRESDDVQALRLGVATTFPIGKVTTVRAGYSMTDRRSEETRENIYYGAYSGSSVHTEVFGQDWVRHDFGWGATHSIRFLDLTGSMRHDLAFGDLFLRLDLRARF
jgi:hypothetical protein